MYRLLVSIAAVIVLISSRNCSSADEVVYKGKPASVWIKQLKDRDESFRLDAVYALRKIGTDEDGVVSALVETLADKEQTVREAARSALDSLPLNELTALDVNDTKVTDAVLKEIAKFKNLTTLGLCGTQVSDTGMKEIANLKNLTRLALNRTNVTDAGMKDIANLKNLKELYLPDTKVTDEGLKEIAKLKNLTHIFLNGTKVTDAGLKDFATLKNLTYLDLTGTQVTDSGVSELRKALPKCSIFRSDGEF